ncbi:PAS domain-containing sensor histidine kinase [Candidatus Woesearchaeota archaeon]|nr:PAS domain-containing sensor histidine kinase [Candidatus Woesearchaeota archaeon]MCF7901371.1 PAS domain-containing sensor histidine kinase [Candidatus Woesearchaeota archaeon]MCF8013371.1 PAS domain-containing sensor histidine kinase [Candidatus Woesearchaeota archaeon]
MTKLEELLSDEEFNKLDTNLKNKLISKFNEMEDELGRFNLIKNNSLTGYARHKMIFDENGKSLDYVFLEVNEKFEEMTNLKSTNILNKGLKETLKGSEFDSENWISRYGFVVKKKGFEVFEDFSSFFNKWYKVSVFYSADDEFITLFDDVTDIKNKERDLNLRVKQLNAFHELGKLTSETNSLEDIFDVFVNDILPNSLQYPDIAFGVLDFDGKRYLSSKVVEDLENFSISSDVIINGKMRGNLKVGYLEDKLFLPEEKENVDDLVERICNVVDRLSTHKILKLSETRYKAVVDNSPISMFIADENGNYLYVNPEAINLLGFSEEELLNLSIPELLTQEYLEKGIAVFKELKENKIVYDSELQLKSKNGPPVDILLNASFVENVGYIGQAIDISFQNKISGQLEESLTKYKSLFDNAPSGVVNLSKNLKVLDVNNYVCEISGYSKDYYVGKHIKDIANISAKDIPKLLNISKDLFLGKNIKPFNYDWFDIDGNKRTSFANVVPLKLNGKKESYQISLVDVTEMVSLENNLNILTNELKEAYEVLEKKNVELIIANNIKDDFLNNLSHEIRTPLTGISSGVDYFYELSLEQVMDDEQMMFLDLIKGAKDRLLRTITNLQSYVDLYVQDCNLMPERINVSDYVNKIISKYDSNKNIKISNENVMDSLFVDVDVDALKISLDNIIHNSINYSKNNNSSFVKVDLYEENEFVVFRVEDNGVGMSSEYLKNDVFKPFNQESGGFAKKYQGTGSGLAVTKKFLEKSGAILNVVSEKEKGTVVEVKFKK